MNFEIELFSGQAFINQPQGILGWVGWGTLLMVIVLLLWRWQQYNKRWGGTQWAIFAVLLVMIPLTSLFLAVRLPASASLISPDTLEDSVGPAVVVFAALPWVLAAGLLGPAPAAVLGMVSGLLLGLWETHSPFTLLEFALLAVLLGAMFQQRYRTLFYRLLRQPLLAALLLSLLYPLIYVIDTLLVAGNSLAIRMDYAFSLSLSASLALALELLAAGLFAQVVSWMLPNWWANHNPLLPSPAERSLQTRQMTSMAPLAIALVVALVAGDWIVAGSAARNMLPRAHEQHRPDDRRWPAVFRRHRADAAAKYGCRPAVDRRLGCREGSPAGREPAHGAVLQSVVSAGRTGRPALRLPGE